MLSGIHGLKFSAIYLNLYQFGLSEMALVEFQVAVSLIPEHEKREIIFVLELNNHHHASMKPGPMMNSLSGNSKYRPVCVCMSMSRERERER